MRKKLLKCVQNNLNLALDVPRTIVCAVSRKELGVLWLKRTRKGAAIKGRVANTPFQVKCVFDKKRGFFTFRHKIKSSTLGWQGTVSVKQEADPERVSEVLRHLLLEIVEELRV